MRARVSTHKKKRNRPRVKRCSRFVAKEWDYRLWGYFRSLCACIAWPCDGRCARQLWRAFGGSA